MPARFLLVLPLLLGLSVGCGGDSAGKKPEPDAGDLSSAPENDGSAPDADLASSNNKARLQGRVVYSDGSALGQVDVKIAGKTYRSDSRGVFDADDLPEGEHEVVVSDDRVSAAQLKVSVRNDRVTQAELAVLPIKKVAIKDVTAGGQTVAAADNVKLTLQPSSLRLKSSRAMATGEAESRYALVKGNVDLRAAPGRLKGTRDGAAVDLESHAMVDMRLFQGEEELELTAPADVEIPLGPNTFTDKQEIDAWSFDTATGAWKVDGRAVVDRSAGGNGVVKIKAAHFSWWAVATPLPDLTCVSGKLLLSQGVPLPYTWVQAVGTSYGGVAWAQTEADGSFCLALKPGSTSQLSAFGAGATSFFSWSQSVTATTAAAACGAPSNTGCSSLGEITGTNLFDDCTGNVTSDQNHVLLLSSGNAALDTAVQTGLERFGHRVTLGPIYYSWGGTNQMPTPIDLTPYDAVYLQANANYGGDMPLAAQRQLINWVNCGGGLVTVEWTTWKINGGTFQLIDAVFPANRTGAYETVNDATYTKVTDDPTISRGLPDTFTFTTTNYGGTQSRLTPRLGAVTYYQSSHTSGTTTTDVGAGLLGWPYNLGRVATFSTTVGLNDVQDENMMRLVANTVDWVQHD